MYKSKKSGKRQTTTRNLGDITINDFANSTVCKSRIKKSNNNVHRVVLKQLEEAEDEGKSWDQKDFEGDLDLIQEENEDGTVSYVIKKASQRQKRRSQREEGDEEKPEPGRDYPIDVWFLISEYIRPEDVGNFAGICKTSFAVVCSAKFWFGMYRRFYKSVPNLPERLQPECLHRKYGLRTSVVRSLFYMYQPYVDRLKSVCAFAVHPDVLLKRQCVVTWHQKKKKHWLYYFKLQKNAGCPMSRSPANDGRQPDILETLDDVFANSDENCRIMQITSSHFIAFPVVLGLTLTSVSLTLSQGFRYYRLQLGFGSGIASSSNYTTGGSSVIVLDPVIDLKVLDWWHPLYPTNHNSIGLLLNQESE